MPQFPQTLMSSVFEDFWAIADPDNIIENKTVLNKIIGFMLNVLIFYNDD
jgi:hypothetical protein